MNKVPKLILRVGYKGRFVSKCKLVHQELTKSKVSTILSEAGTGAEAGAQGPKADKFSQYLTAE